MILIYGKLLNKVIPYITRNISPSIYYIGYLLPYYKYRYDFTEILPVVNLSQLNIYCYVV